MEEGGAEKETRLATKIVPFLSESQVVQHSRALQEYYDEQKALQPTLPVSSASVPPLPILLVEDNPADIHLFSLALKESKVSCELCVLQSGSEVQGFVQHQTTVPEAPPFQLIIVDIGVAGMSVEEVVAALRNLPSCKEARIVIFSSFDEWVGQQRSIQSKADAFVRKPVGLQPYMDAVYNLVHG